MMDGINKYMAENEDGWSQLAIAIVRNSIYEYANTFKRLKKHPEDKSLQWKIDEIKGFYRSRWFKKICNIEPEWLIEKIEANHENLGGVGRKKTVT